MIKLTLKQNNNQIYLKEIHSVYSYRGSTQVESISNIFEVNETVEEVLALIEAPKLGRPKKEQNQ